MNVITIEVLCPSTSRSYDYRLPIKMQIGDIKNQIIEDIRIFEGLPELFDSGEILIYGENGYIEDTATLEQAGVKNGDRIMIV